MFKQSANVPMAFKKFYLYNSGMLLDLIDRYYFSDFKQEKFITLALKISYCSLYGFGILKLLLLIEKIISALNLTSSFNACYVYYTLNNEFKEARWYTTSLFHSSSPASSCVPDRRRKFSTFYQHTREDRDDIPLPFHLFSPKIANYPPMVSKSGSQKLTQKSGKRACNYVAYFP